MYDAAVLLVAKLQDVLAGLGKADAKGAVQSTPIGAFFDAVTGGVAYFADAAANGQWAKILCYKPFKTVAAVTLTVMRIVVSYVLSGAEIACSMLYATPVYVAVLGCGVCALGRIAGGDGETGEKSTVEVAVVEKKPDLVDAVEVKAPKKVVEEPAEAEEKMPMPATAVFEASNPVMTDGRRHGDAPRRGGARVHERQLEHQLGHLLIFLRIHRDVVVRVVVGSSMDATLSSAPMYAPPHRPTTTPALRWSPAWTRPRWIASTRS